ncbi:MAG: phosphatidylglycerophosphatase A [Desulfobacterales bacterium]
MDLSFQTIVFWLSTGLGLGYVPLVPGAAGALAGAILAFGLKRLQFRTRTAAVAVFIAVSIPICEFGSQPYGGQDHSSIVADELFAFPLTTLTLSMRSRPVHFAGIFIVNRVLDRLKPPPAGIAERLPGGFGIVMDDVVANTWILIFVTIGHYMLRKKHL